MKHIIGFLIGLITGLFLIGYAYYSYKYLKTDKKMCILYAVMGVIFLLLSIQQLFQKESFTETQKKKLTLKYQMMGYEAGDTIANLIIQNEDILQDLDNIFAQYSKTLEMNAQNTKDHTQKNRLLNASSFFNNVSDIIKCGVLGENCSVNEKMEHHYVVAGPLQVRPNTEVRHVIVKPFDIKPNVNIMHVVVSQDDVKDGTKTAHDILKSPHIDNDDLPRHSVVVAVKDVRPNVVINHVVVAPEDVLPNVVLNHLIVKPHQVKNTLVPSHVVIASHIAERTNKSMVVVPANKVKPDVVIKHVVVNAIDVKPGAQIIHGPVAKLPSNHVIVAINDVNPSAPINLVAVHPSEVCDNMCATNDLKTLGPQK